METSQIILFSGIAFLLIMYVSRRIRYRGIEQVEPGDLPADGSLVLLDVRTDRERSARHIKGSIHIPLQELSSRTGELSRYREKRIICYCQSGARSMAATRLLKEKGFTASNLKGGMANWNLQHRSS